MIETLVPQIVKALRETERVCGQCGAKHPDERPEERWITQQRPWDKKDLWLAQMVVGIVEERADKYAEMAVPEIAYNEEKEWWIEVVLNNFSLTPEDWLWLKEKVDHGR